MWPGCRELEGLKCGHERWVVIRNKRNHWPSYKEQVICQRRYTLSATYVSPQNQVFLRLSQCPFHRIISAVNCYARPKESQRYLSMKGGDDFSRSQCCINFPYSQPINSISLGQGPNGFFQRAVTVFQTSDILPDSSQDAGVAT